MPKLQKALNERLLIVRDFLRGQSPEVIRRIRSIRCDRTSQDNNRLLSLVDKLQKLLSTFKLRERPLPSRKDANSPLENVARLRGSRSRVRRATRTEREIVASAARVMRTMRQELYREDNDGKEPVRRVIRTIVDDPPEPMLKMVCYIVDFNRILLSNRAGNRAKFHSNHLNEAAEEKKSK